MFKQIKKISNISHILWRIFNFHSSFVCAQRNTGHIGYENWLLSIVIMGCFLQSGRAEAAQDEQISIMKKAETFHFSIPQQRADLSLITFAEQSNITLLFPFDEINVSLFT